jgi:hypothetical protein
VRRRIPRVLKGSPTPRALEGLLLGLDDGELAVRRACGVALAWMRAQKPELELSDARLHAAAARELARTATDREAQLDHVFALLAAAGEPEPLRVSRWALRGQDQRLRGTALEYLEHVLPEAVRQPLLARLGGAAPPAPRARALDEVEEELRRSSATLERKR